MAALAVFVLIKNIHWDKIFRGIGRSIVSTMASASFGIYLIHRIVMYYELQYLPFAEDKNLWQTVCIFITYIAALIIALVIGKIPVLKKVVGK